MPKNTYYHLAPTASREDILREGLVPWNESRPHTFKGIPPKPYVYFWKSLDEASQWANRFVNMFPEGLGDIWEASLSEDLVEPDNRLDNAWRTAEIVRPENITLAKECYYKDTAIYHGRCPDCDSEWDRETNSCLECDPPESY